MKTKPWISGPVEILQHAVRLMNTNDDADRRLAFLNIDNAVELIIKTYLSLPKRITGVNLSRKKYDEISISFPRLVKTLENQASEKIRDINFDEIEWYHRVRNKLYHDGNGVTVEKDIVESYATLAESLLEKLFDIEFEHKRSREQDLLVKFFKAWNYTERRAHMIMVIREGKTGVDIWPFPELPKAIEWLHSTNTIPDEIHNDFKEYKAVWEKISAGDPGFTALLSTDLISGLYDFGDRLHHHFFNFK
jgi:hypothetical protein